jgi:Flp pilus assembly protein TadG
VSRAGRSGGRSRGQSLVEFAVALPVFLLLLFGMLEFGFVFSHHLTLEYATREGARTGAALGKNDQPSLPCGYIDNHVIAAVQRVLTSPGSQASISRVSEIRIWKASATGTPTGQVNVWTPGVTADFYGSGALVFKETSHGWNTCTRVSSWSVVGGVPVAPDSMGVSLVYSYLYITPLGLFMGITGTATLTITDKTVMALNPS